MNIITSAFLAARPKRAHRLLIPVWAGCMVVQKLTGHWDVRLALLTFASCLCIQIACNFFQRRHRPRETRGHGTPRRPRPHDGQRALSHRAVMLFGGLFLAAACLLALPLIELRGWPIIAIGIPSLYFSYGYTGGPWPGVQGGWGKRSSSSSSGWWPSWAPFWCR